VASFNNNLKIIIYQRFEFHVTLSESPPDILYLDRKFFDLRWEEKAKLIRYKNNENNELILCKTLETFLHYACFHWNKLVFLAFAGSQNEDEAFDIFHESLAKVIFLLQSPLGGYLEKEQINCNVFFEKINFFIKRESFLNNLAIISIILRLVKHNINTKIHVKQHQKIFEFAIDLLICYLKKAPKLNEFTQNICILIIEDIQNKLGKLEERCPEIAPAVEPIHNEITKILQIYLGCDVVEPKLGSEAPKLFFSQKQDGTHEKPVAKPKPRAFFPDSKSN